VGAELVLMRPRVLEGAEEADLLGAEQHDADRP
jgi:hypothetical protein